MYFLFFYFIESSTKRIALSKTLSIVFEGNSSFVSLFEIVIRSNAACLSNFLATYKSPNDKLSSARAKFSLIPLSI